MTNDGDDSEDDIAGMYDRDGSFDEDEPTETTDERDTSLDSEPSEDVADSEPSEDVADSEPSEDVADSEPSEPGADDSATESDETDTDEGVVLGEDTGGGSNAAEESAAEEADESTPDTPEESTGDKTDERDETARGGAGGMYDTDERVTPGDAPVPDADTPVGGDSTDDSDDSGGISIEPGTDEQETIEGTFYVKYAQDQSVTLHDVNTAQICTLVQNPGFERHEIVEGTLAAQPPMGVSYLFEELDQQYSIPVETSPEAPTKQVREIAVEELESGQALPIEREGKGEIHILRVESDLIEDAIEDLSDDETTYKNAARFEHVERVEIRSDADEGVLSVRYLP